MRIARNSVERKNIGIAMSGGVDSTSCALLMKQQYNVKGYFMKLAQPDISYQLERVHDIAERLKIDLKIIDLQEQFQEKILDYFSTSYFQGLTPNPCVVCNKEIKFGLFMDIIINDDNDKMATGHYACIAKHEKLYTLSKGMDETKDQSYFLSRLTQEQLGQVIFPLGKMTKSEIYEFAESHGFTNFRGKESQDICFLGDTKVGDYLSSKQATEKPGPILSTDGSQLGTHAGLHLFTIGQRRGLGLPDTTPWYVVGIKPDDNCLIVGKNHELSKTHIEIQNIHWLSGVCPNLEREYLVRIRYSHKGSTARLEQKTSDHFQLIFNEPQRAVTPGQFAVVYDNDKVIGSGVIL